MLCLRCWQVNARPWCCTARPCVCRVFSLDLQNDRGIILSPMSEAGDQRSRGIQWLAQGHSIVSVLRIGPRSYASKTNGLPPPLSNSRDLVLSVQSGAASSPENGKCQIFQTKRRGAWLACEPTGEEVSHPQLSMTLLSQGQREDGPLGSESHLLSWV